MRRLSRINLIVNCVDSMRTVCPSTIRILSFLYKAQNRKGSPRWGGPTRILGIDETCATVHEQSQTFKVARHCVRKRMEEADASDEERQKSLHRGDHCMDQPPAGSGMAPALDEGMDNAQEMAAKETAMESGGRSTDGAREPSMASPRLIPAPDSPQHAARTPPDQVPGDTGNTSTSFDRKCAPSQAPVCENANND